MENIAFNNAGTIWDAQDHRNGFCPALSVTTQQGRSGGPPSGCGFLDQALQRQAHRVIKIGGGEVGSELQLGDDAHEEYAALLYW